MRGRFAVPLFLLLAGVQPGRLRAQDPIRDVPGTATASPVQRPPSARPADTSEALLLRRSLDSLREVNAALRLKVPFDAASRERFEKATDLGKWLLAVWFVFVLVYLIWAVRRYVYNFGLSNREWKILYPEVYETWLDRKLARLLGYASYRARRKELIDHHQALRREQAEGDFPEAVITTPFPEPLKNPYEEDSFGLPPGTIRGVMALTALVVFVVMESVNLHSPASLEGQFDGLTTAFQMVLAFYFGSKAVEVLQAKMQKQTDATASADAEAALPRGAAPAGQATLPRAIEGLHLPEGSSIARFANLVASLGGGAAPAAAAPAAVNPAAMPLAKRVLTMTAAFETGRGYPSCFGTVAGNFDGQGLSFGVLQWNIGQRSVQPLWTEMRDNHAAELRAALGGLYDEFSRVLDRPQDEQMRWALGIQTRVPNRENTWRIVDAWRNALQTLGMTEQMIAIEVNRADATYHVALAFCRDYQLTRERGAALMFDIRVQNGSVDRGGAGARIRADFEQIDPSLSSDEQEVARMESIARRRADVAKREWRNDVLQRKLTIALGKGAVHNRTYDLAKDFGIGLAPF